MAGLLIVLVLAGLIGLIVRGKPRGSSAAPRGRDAAPTLSGGILGIFGTIALLASDTGRDILLSGPSAVGAVAFLLVAIIGMVIWPSVVGKAIGVLGASVLVLDLLQENPGTGIPLLLVLVLALWLWGAFARGRT